MRARLVIAALALAAAGVHATELRTLFHSAAERQRLDALRRGEPPESAAATRRAPAVVGGFVKRSDGRNTAWVDGKRMTGSSAAPWLDPAQVRDPQHPDTRPIEIKRSR